MVESRTVVVSEDLSKLRGRINVIRVKARAVDDLLEPGAASLDDYPPGCKVQIAELVADILEAAVEVSTLVE